VQWILSAALLLASKTSENLSLYVCVQPMETRVANVFSFHLHLETVLMSLLHLVAVDNLIHQVL